MNKEQKFLNELLTSDNVTKNITSNIQQLLLTLPEIKCMIGFEHKHPHHHLDVWEHTLYALSLSPNNFDVRLALLLHDIGKPKSFQEDNYVRHFKGHPALSGILANDILTRLGYPKEYVDFICEIITKHDTPLSSLDVFSNPQLSKQIFEVQKCDALAHNPSKNEKRLAYIEKISKVLNEI